MSGCVHLSEWVCGCHPTLVMTGQVLVESASSQRAHARALLDTGATLSLITSKLAH